MRLFTTALDPLGTVLLPFGRRSELHCAWTLRWEPDLFEATVGFFARLIWFSLTQLLGYWTGRAIIQGLSLGHVDVSDYGHHDQKPFKIFWRRGKQPIVSFLVAIALGQFLWFGAVLGVLAYLSRG